MKIKLNVMSAEYKERENKNLVNLYILVYNFFLLFLYAKYM